MTSQFDKHIKKATLITRLIMRVLNEYSKTDADRRLAITAVTTAAMCFSLRMSGISQIAFYEPGDRPRKKKTRPMN